MAERRNVTVDVDEFIRTRDALTTAFMSLSSSVDKAVKAYIDHTNAVITGDAVLNVSFLTQPFNAIQSLDLPTGIRAANSIAEPPPVEAATGGAGEDEKLGKKRKRNYKARDPNAPKRPLTAYFRFLSEVRPLIAAEMAKSGAQHKPGELSQVATERWNAMSEEAKLPYHDAYRAAMEVYKVENDDYKTRTDQLTGDVDAGPVKTAAAIEDDTESSEDEPAAPPPPPPKTKKSASPEAVKKTPKLPKKEKVAEPASATTATPKKASAPTPKEKKAPVAASPAVTSTPMFNSINPEPAAPSTKKRKSETSEEVPKKKRGRPSKASLEAAGEDAVTEPKSEKKDKPKKKKTAEA